MMWITVAILLGLLGTTTSNPIDHEQEVIGLDFSCRTFQSYMNIFELCGPNTSPGMEVDGYYISAENMRTTVSNACFPSFDTYTQCVLENTASCDEADRALVLNEMDAYFEKCWNNSWIYEYVLNGFDNVNLRCLSIRGLCNDGQGQNRYVFPEGTMPLTDAIEYLRSKTGHLFQCIKDRTADILVQDLPNCTSKWEDIFFVYIIYLTNVPEMYLKMFPEQIEMIKLIRNSQQN